MESVKLYNHLKSLFLSIPNHTISFDEKTRTVTFSATKLKTGFVYEAISSIPIPDLLSLVEEGYIEILYCNERFPDSDANDLQVKLKEKAIAYYEWGKL